VQWWESRAHARITFNSKHDDRPNDIAVVGAGRVYTTGRFAGEVDFDPGAGQVVLTENGSGVDICVSVLGDNGWAVDAHKRPTICTFSPIRRQR
jgi:hypothetical protein